MKKRDIESKQRRLHKEVLKLEDMRSDKLAEIDRLASLHCGFSKGDEVVYNGPDPSRFLHGIVTRVRRGGDGTPAIVHVRPFLKKRKRSLAKAWHSTRVFVDPKLLKLVRPSDKVAPYER